MLWSEHAGGDRATDCDQDRSAEEFAVLRDPLPRRSPSYRPARDVVTLTAATTRIWSPVP